MTDFLIISPAEFKAWLFNAYFKRPIRLIQNHHTYLPGYNGFNGKNHLTLLAGMEKYHVQNNGWAQIAQNITTFPDGKIAICRPFDQIPAGIKGANKEGICIEHLGNFDINGDKMTQEHRRTIMLVNRLLCDRFVIPIDTSHVVYHHWYDLDTGARENGAGKTKSCPGSNFFGGNSVEAAKKYFISEIEKVAL